MFGLTEPGAGSDAVELLQQQFRMVVTLSSMGAGASISEPIVTGFYHLCKDRSISKVLAESHSS